MDSIIKSFLRYLLAALVTMLATVSLPGVGEFASFLKVNTGELTEILATILLGLLSYWSVRKNMTNKKIDRGTK